MVEACIKQQWSPEQAAGWLRRKRQLSISHETIYRHIWRDRKKGGLLYLTHVVLLSSNGAPSRRSGRSDAVVPELLSVLQPN
jgi:IS30 family transposase